MPTDKDKKKEAEEQVEEDVKEEEKEEPKQEEVEEAEEPKEEEEEEEEEEPEEEEEEEAEEKEEEEAEEKEEESAPQLHPGASEGGEDRRAEEPAPGAETKQAIDDLDEGWPKSWIVTTAILGIVAIIIIARLVGAAKGKEGQVEHPGGPEAGKQEQKGGPEAKHEPKHDPKQPQPKNEPKQKAVGPMALRLDVKKLSVPNGLHCIGRDKKLRKMNDHFQRHAECLMELGPHKGYRLDFKPAEGEAEFNAQVLPPPDADVEFIMSSLCLPGGTHYWIGGNVHLTRQRALMVVLNNPAPKAIEMSTVKLTTMTTTKRPPGTTVTSIEAIKPVFTNVGHHCLGTDKKLHSMVAGKPAPKICALLVKDAAAFQIELKRQLVPSPIKIMLQAEKSRTIIAEGIMVPRATPEGPLDVFEGSIRGLEDNAVLVLINSKKDVAIKSLFFVVKKN